MNLNDYMFLSMIIHPFTTHLAPPWIKLPNNAINVDIFSKMCHFIANSGQFYEFNGLYNVLMSCMQFREWKNSSKKSLSFFLQLFHFLQRTAI